MQIVQHPNNFVITIAFDSYRNRNQTAVKSIPGAYFSGSKRAWIVPKKEIEKIQQLVVTHRAELMVLDDRPMEIGEVKEMATLNIPLVLKQGEMRDYQKNGVAQGLIFKRYINGDEQGLGKTLQSIATVYAAHQQGEKTVPVLVICPSSTKINWQREVQQWTPWRAVILDDRNKSNWHRLVELNLAQVFIVNYESLKKFFVDFYPPKGEMKNSMDIILNPRTELFKSIIIDESHRCKSQQTQQTKLALRLAMKKEWVILLTGTPVVNKPIDLFAQLAIMGRLNDFGGPKVFKMRYCEGGNGSSNLKELNYMLKSKCFFRREKKDVAKDLPEKQRQTILCDITTRHDYTKAKNDFVKFLQEQGWDDAEIRKKLRGEIMVKMGELKRISALGKLNEVYEFVEEVIESGEKLILFCSLHSIVDAVLQKFPHAVTVTGRDSMNEKQTSIDKFQKDPSCKLIVCNIKAAGVGITLTASSRVAFIEYPWTYADCVQCEDRAHRIGQVNNVMCTYFLGHNTIDEQLFEMIQSKAATANAITGATDTMETDFIDNVMNLFK